MIKQNLKIAKSVTPQTAGELISDLIGFFPVTETVKAPKSLNSGSRSYAVRVCGNCLSPIFQNEDVLIVDPDQKPVSGDCVVIWFNTGNTPIVKRLLLNLPPESMRFLKQDSAELLIICEQLNPPKQYKIGFSKVKAVHKVLGKV